VRNSFVYAQKSFSYFLDYSHYLEWNENIPADERNNYELLVYPFKKYYVNLDFDFEDYPEMTYEDF
jgi:hypothetical protein